MNKDLEQKISNVIYAAKKTACYVIGGGSLLMVGMGICKIPKVLDENHAKYDVYEQQIDSTKKAFHKMENPTPRQCIEYDQQLRTLEQERDEIYGGHKGVVGVMAFSVVTTVGARLIMKGYNMRKE